MKYIFVFLLCHGLFFPAIAQRKTDVEKENLSGAVKSVSAKKINHYDEAANDSGKTVQQDFVSYDKKGNEIERVIYSDYGFLVGKKVNKYDEHGNLSESVLTDEKDKILQKQVYQYQGDKLIELTLFYPQRQAQLKQSNLLDVKGNITEQSYFVSEKPIGKTVYKYDDSYNLIEVAFFAANGNKAIAPVGPCFSSHKLTYTYSGKKISEAVAYEPDGKVKKRWKYTYDSKGRLAEDVREDNYSTVRFIYTYQDDSNGNWVKQTAIATNSSKMKLFGNTFPESKRTILTLREITYY